MTNQEDFWQIQDPKKPLFEDLIWSRPENKMHAGKMLIVGGNAHGFSDVALAYSEANKAGAGTIKVLLPDVLKRTVGKLLDNTFYCPSTPSGSFAKSSLAEILDYAEWADIVLFAGDFGRNSETASLLESFVSKYKGMLCLTKDGLDYFVPNPEELIHRPKTQLVATIAELQKLSIKIDPENVIKFNMSLVQLVSSLHSLSRSIPSVIVTKHLDEILVAFDGKVSTTKVSKKFEPWRISVAAFGSVWYMQNQNKPYQSVTSSLIGVIESITGTSPVGRPD